ncbi:MAG TPA: JAB domain-containing protein [Candidatus Saccharimonadales bacterium]|nr:JAB domain-containing protein [Candidatus Saccharimonadales bacterium]
MSKSDSPATTEDILSYLNYIRHKRQEYFVCLSLNVDHKVIKRRTVTIGLLDMALAHPREVFAGPLKDRAAAIIVAHNHPSGNPQPSKEDIKTTEQLVAAGQILGLRVQDHIIVASDKVFSFRAHLLIL